MKDSRACALSSLYADHVTAVSSISAARFVLMLAQSVTMNSESATTKVSRELEFDVYRYHTCQDIVHRKECEPHQSLENL